jgi:tetratricopeptide (TPR) repeat protein
VLDTAFSITWRNLAIAYQHSQSDNSEVWAISSLEKAVQTANPYPSHFAELDRLYKAAGTSVEKRLAVLEKNQSISTRNDEALGSMISLKTYAGKPEESIRLLENHIFSIWEGGNPFNTGQAWVDANMVLGLKHFNAKKYEEAIACFEAAHNPPENLRAEQRFDQHNAMISYWKGCSYEGLGDTTNSRKAWNEVITPGSSNLREGVAGGGTAAGGGMGPGSAGSGGTRRMGGPLLQGEQRYYQALANQKLGKSGEENVFNDLITSAASVLNPVANTVSDVTQAPGQGQSRTNVVIAHYNAGLGYAGLGIKLQAKEEFEEALKLQPDYLNAKIALDQL